MVVIVGGGLTAASAFHHLTRAQIPTIAFERNELTSGSTWWDPGYIVRLPQAGGADEALWRWHEEALAMLEDPVVGGGGPGSLRLLSSQQELEQLAQPHVARSRLFGRESEILDRAGVLTKILDTVLGSSESLLGGGGGDKIRLDNIVGALWSPSDTFVDSGLLCKQLFGAVPAGAAPADDVLPRPTELVSSPGSGSVFTHATVVAIQQRLADGKWEVMVELDRDGRSRREVVVCRHVINAAGLWAGDISGLAGVAMPPLTLLQHQYAVTEAADEMKETRGGDDPPVKNSEEPLLPLGGILLPAQQAGPCDDASKNVGAKRPLPIIIDPSSSTALRQEPKSRFLIDIFEKNPVVLKPSNTDRFPPFFLFDAAVDRLIPNIEAATTGPFPFLASAKFRKLFSVPVVFSEDGAPIVGPAAKKGFWTATACQNAAQSLGAGAYLARQIAAAEGVGRVEEGSSVCSTDLKEGVVVRVAGGSSNFWTRKHVDPQRWGLLSTEHQAANVIEEQDFADLPWSLRAKTCYEERLSAVSRPPPALFAERECAGGESGAQQELELVLQARGARLCDVGSQTMPLDFAGGGDHARERASILRRSWAATQLT